MDFTFTAALVLLFIGLLLGALSILITSVNYYKGGKKYWFAVSSGAALSLPALVYTNQNKISLLVALFVVLCNILERYDK